VVASGLANFLANFTIDECLNKFYVLRTGKVFTETEGDSITANVCELSDFKQLLQIPLPQFIDFRILHNSLSDR
jgi:hypothetical protein